MLPRTISQEKAVCWDDLFIENRSKQMFWLLVLNVKQNLTEVTQVKITYLQMNLQNRRMNIPSEKDETRGTHVRLDYLYSSFTGKGIFYFEALGKTYYRSYKQRFW